jgi:ribosomal protein S3AE
MADCKEIIVDGKKVDCAQKQECFKMIQKIVDGQASEQELEQFKAKMGDCLPCEKNFELEKCMKEALQLKLSKKDVPTNLLDCIKEKIANF